MYLPQIEKSEIVNRQRSKRQVLSEALNKNQIKLQTVQQEIRFLTQPLRSDYEDECERQDDEIDKLRRVCQAMLNEIEYLKRANEPKVDQLQPLRPAPPPPFHPPMMSASTHPSDSLQRTRPQTLLPRQEPSSSLSSQSPITPISQPIGLQPNLSPAQENHISPKIIDTNVENRGNNDELPWQCNMCTFQNHPLLNKCECCDNVRILPGSIRIVPSRPPPPVPNANRENRSLPVTPASPGSSSARVLSLPNEYNQSGVVSSSSEGCLPQFIEDVVI